MPKSNFKVRKSILEDCPENRCSEKPSHGPNSWRVMDLSEEIKPQIRTPPKQPSGRCISKPSYAIIENEDGTIILQRTINEITEDVISIYPKKSECSFCKKAGQEYNHSMRLNDHPTGPVVCEFLKTISCSYCGTKGHTGSYCPVYKEELVTYRNSVQVKQEEISVPTPVPVLVKKELETPERKSSIFDEELVESFMHLNIKESHEPRSRSSSEDSLDDAETLLKGFLPTRLFEDDCSESTARLSASSRARGPSPKLVSKTCDYCKSKKMPKSIYSTHSMHVLKDGQFTIICPLFYQHNSSEYEKDNIPEENKEGDEVEDEDAATLINSLGKLTINSCEETVDFGDVPRPKFSPEPVRHSRTPRPSGFTTRSVNSSLPYVRSQAGSISYGASIGSVGSSFASTISSITQASDEDFNFSREFDELDLSGSVSSRLTGLTGLPGLPGHFGSFQDGSGPFKPYNPHEYSSNPSKQEHTKTKDGSGIRRDSVHSDSDPNGSVPSGSVPNIPIPVTISHTVSHTPAGVVPVTCSSPYHHLQHASALGGFAPVRVGSESPGAQNSLQGFFKTETTTYFYPSPAPSPVPGMMPGSISSFN